VLKLPQRGQDPGRKRIFTHLGLSKRISWRRISNMSGGVWTNNSPPQEISPVCYFLLPNFFQEASYFRLSVEWMPLIIKKWRRLYDALCSLTMLTWPPSIPTTQLSQQPRYPRVWSQLGNLQHPRHVQAASCRRKHAKFGAISDNFRLRSRISPERILTSGKRHYRLESLWRSTKNGELWSTNNKVYTSNVYPPKHRPRNHGATGHVPLTFSSGARNVVCPSLIMRK